MRLSVILLLVIAINALQANAQDVDPRYLKELVKTLASDSMEGRHPGTPGFERAGRFIEQSFHDAGVNDVTRQTFNLLEKGYSEIYLKTNNKKFSCPKDIILQGLLQIDDGSEMEIVFAGRGGKELDSIDVKGRLVVVFVPNLRSTYDICRNLHKRGAVALVAANPDKPGQFDLIQRGFGDYVMAKRLALDGETPRQMFPGMDSIKSVPTFLVRNEVVAQLMNTSLENLVRAAKRPKNIAVAKVSVKAEFVTRKFSSYNIIARLPGSSDTSIVVTGHFDHVGKRDKQIFHGADDNASGTAGMIALAKISAADPSRRYAMTFVAFTAEESGLLGSRYYTTTADFDPTKVLININMDMMGSTDEKHAAMSPYIYVVAHTADTPWKIFLETAAAETGLVIDYSEINVTGIFQRSDQYSFHKRGIAALHLFSGLHNRYHQTTDTYETLDYSLLARRVRFADQFIEMIQER